MTWGARLVPCLLLLGLTAAAQPVAVTVQTQGERVILDVSAPLAVRHEIAWAVLTDYEHMAQFVSTLKSSAVLDRRGNRLEVEQHGEARRGPLHFSFATVRAVELVDEHEIRSQLIRGDFKSYEFVTRLVTDASGAITIVHHGEYVPTTWVPPIIGPALIESGTRAQYEELIAEMTRRQAIERSAPHAR